jgi:osmotically-inducible protein OsmY
MGDTHGERQLEIRAQRRRERREVSIRGQGGANEISIKPSVPPNAVRDAIEKALNRDAEIDADHVRVTADGGKVTLAGTIPSWNERAAAGWAAWSAPGVTEVYNDLMVSN